MKVKFRFGIKNYSGTLDQLNYADFGDRGCIARMLSDSRETTAQNEEIKQKSQYIVEFYRLISDEFKQDLALYTMKMYNLKENRTKIAGNRYSTFVKLMWAVSKLENGAIDLSSLSIDDAVIGSYENFSTVKAAVENGYLPVVPGYEELTAPMC